MRRHILVITLVLALASGAVPFSIGSARASGTHGYVVVFAGQQAADGAFDLTVSHEAILSLVASAGGTIIADLSAQIGVLVVESANPLFAAVLRGSVLVEEVGQDFGWKAVPTYDEAVASGAPVNVDAGGGGPEQTEDPLESQQWSMMQIRAPEAHAIQAGWRAVDVGILDTGIDGAHLDFDDDGVAGGATNVDCARGRDFIPLGPGIGNPGPCIDNGFHGTHVAGIVAAQANGLGVVGVAPNVTLVPVKVCDTAGFCYAGSVVGGITYAGDAKLDVINMSFFVDDDEFMASTEFKCMEDATQRAFRRSVERAIQYARSQGVTPVAALGNSDTDLAHAPSGNNCDVVPAETSGVVGTMALGAQSQKASYSNYGTGATDMAAPGGNGTTGDCMSTVLSTFPANAYGCIQGTSMASPHAAGVAALVVSQFGVLGSDGDVEMSPTQVEGYLQSTAIDLGLEGYDICFGHGRVDALRAVQHDTSDLLQANPLCPEYAE
ncbi:MAG TPA: S8 family serine peptidase [Anaerolineae bacterium]|nr:S8 family serine peptidase [Anaerolineae bacterium]